MSTALDIANSWAYRRPPIGKTTMPRAEAPDHASSTAHPGEAEVSPLWFAATEVRSAAICKSIRKRHP